jgi:hypothetical protein
VLFDRFGRLDPIACPGLSYYHVAFLAGWAGYMAGVFFLLLVVRKERNPTPQL